MPDTISPNMISIVIPSRLAVGRGAGDRPGNLFLKRACETIRTQTIFDPARIQVIVGLDTGVAVPEDLGVDITVEFAHSEGHSQAAALNAAARRIRGNIVAFLEDDDQWQPQFLEFGLAALGQCDFVSSTQLELTDGGEVLRINDCATPSGWLMARATWQSVGPFDENYRFHLDSEWLGRLREQNVKRIHLVEATAPTEREVAETMRPWLANIFRYGGPKISLMRHSSPWPLVVRLIHANSGMYRIFAEPAVKAESLEEVARLRRRFVTMPW